MRKIIQPLYTYPMPINGIYTPYEIERVQKAINYIHQFYKNTISADQLGMEVNLDVKQLQSLMHHMTGLTVHNYQSKVRLDQATNDLADFKHSIKAIAYKHGFSSSSHFDREFKKANGKTPTMYRLELLQNNYCEKKAG